MADDKPLHWTQTAEGRARMSKISRQQHKIRQAKKKDWRQTMKSAAATERDEVRAVAKRAYTKALKPVTITANGWTVTLGGDQVQVSRSKA